MVARKMVVSNLKFCAGDFVHRKQKCRVALGLRFLINAQYKKPFLSARRPIFSILVSDIC